jgi:enediyne polyketide synthase
VSATATRIAIVSLACRFPDAATPAALWDNVMAGRRSFRPLPRERLDLTAYAADRVGGADAITPVKAALLTGWRFDAARFRIPHATVAAADHVHWLALEVAADAIAAAGGTERFDRERVAVVVANTLTGEFSRAATLRLRAPFLDDLLAAAARDGGVDEATAIDVRQRFAAALRARFPDPQEETLAGGLANTIAGRIANVFDLHGGAYVVDAACASSLVAVADACELLASHRADAVIVGAVDLSLDPFELVGFSRNGALARDDMRVFDARSAGFWPGEGAGAAVLMRQDDAVAADLPVRATLRGWGISTDGAGGFTRPALAGQLMALRRAYARADVDPADLGYVEAHGTGTAVGDPVEVGALAELRGTARTTLPIGSIKANIGHTKAAAGLAGLIKTVAALEAGIVPLHVGCRVPHPVFREVDGAVRPALDAEPWRNDCRLAGVSGFGFGGINAHVVVEAAPSRRAVATDVLRHRPQDCELFVFAADEAGELLTTLAMLAGRCSSMSLAELVDAGAECARRMHGGRLRAAIVADTPETLARRLSDAAAAITADHEVVGDGVFVGRPANPPRIGFLFPGQAAPSRPHGGAWARRFDEAQHALAEVAWPPGVDPVDTAVAQPAIAAASLAATCVLARCGVAAVAALGHSLGELSALAWAGAIVPDDVVALARRRGNIIARHALAGGTMLRVAADEASVHDLIAALPLVIACQNGAREIIIAGEKAAIAEGERRAHAAGIDTTRLAVSHAFHTAMMAPAAAPFAAALADVPLVPPCRRVVSSVSGRTLDPETDLKQLLTDQLTRPVLFDGALTRLRDEADILLEVGPGGGLTRLATEAGCRAVTVDAFADTLSPLLGALGTLFAAGAPVDATALYADRRVRPIDLASRPTFLASPCGGSAAPAHMLTLPPPARDDTADTARAGRSALEVVRDVIAEATGFAPEIIGDDDHALDDLHLNSLAVARLVTKAAGLLDASAPSGPTSYATATVREIADGLARAPATGARNVARIAGVAPWVRPFRWDWVERPAPRHEREITWRHVVIDGAAPARAHPVSPEADGILLQIGSPWDERASLALWQACRAAWRQPQIRHLAICHRDAPVAALAASLARDGRFQSVAAIAWRHSEPDVSHLRTLLAGLPDGFSELAIDTDGRCLLPRMMPMQCPEPTAACAIGGDDVVLVIGGGRGLGAECALRLTTATGAALILAGRSRSDHADVRHTLDRAAAAGLHCRYIEADTRDLDAFTAALATVSGDIGPPTVLVHAAGVNQPRRFIDIGDDDRDATLAVKTTGLRNAIAASGPRVRRVIAFGSVIGRLGLDGEAHYALANAWQSAICEDLARSRPDLAPLCIEWSVWDAAGMGERLGAVEALARRGIDAIPLDAGLDMFERLALGGATGTVIATGRFGAERSETTTLPLLRFLDQPVLHYPGVELVVETELSAERDLGLADHRLDGAAIMPAVLGLEAMAQVASALIGRTTPTQIDDIALRRAIVVPDAGRVRIRIMALSSENGRVDAAIRASDDGFSADRMRATIDFAAPEAPAVTQSPCGNDQGFDAAPLYGPMLFHDGRFRRLDRFEVLAARHIVASIGPDAGAPWHGAFEPQDLVLGDPGTRDAMLHCLQVAVPHRRVLPVAVRRVIRHGSAAAVRIEARERSATTDEYVFDIVAWDAAGHPVEEWRGATFRAIARLDAGTVLAAAPACAGAYVERVARETLTDTIEVALVHRPMMARPQRRRHALQALGLDGSVSRRGDGKPLVIGSHVRGHVSLAHRDGTTLAAVAASPIGCDIERVRDWSTDDALAVLPPHGHALAKRLVAGGDRRDVAAARVWTAAEVLRKQGLALAFDTLMTRPLHAGVVMFASPQAGIVTIHIAALDIVVAIGSREAAAGSQLDDIAPQPTLVVAAQ